MAVHRRRRGRWAVNDNYTFHGMDFLVSGNVSNKEMPVMTYKILSGSFLSDQQCDI